MTLSLTRTAPEPHGRAQRQASGRSAAATLAAALLGFFIITLDAVIVNVALPQIRADLGGGIRGLQWVVDGYTLMFAALLLSAGSFSDRMGAKRAFRIGLLVFVAASVACGLAPTLGALVAFRFIQGGAAAAMMPASMSLIGQAYPNPVRRSRAVATWAMGGAVASTSGPILGGILTVVDWRLIFLVNLPVGLVALWLLRSADLSSRHRVPFDWAGQVAGIVAMGALVFGTIEAGTDGLGAAKVIVAFAVAVAATAGFLLIQARVEHPMLPLRLFRIRAVSVAAVTGFAFMVGYYGLPFVMSLYLQQERGFTAMTTGVVFLPMMLVGLALTPLVPPLVARLGARLLVTTGLVAMALGLLAIALAPAQTPVVALSALMVLVGLAGPTVSPPTTTVLLNAVHGHRAGVASGIFNTSRQVGGALTVAVFGGLLAGPAGFHAGMRLSLLLAMGASLLAGAVACAGLRATPRT